MIEYQLLQRIADGDEAALHELYDQYYPRLGYFLLRFTQDPQLAAELINDVFLVVWQKAASFRGDSSPSTWIMGIAYKKALKAFRASKRTPLMEPLDTIEARSKLTVHDTATTEDPYETIQKLTPIHRAVIILTYQFGYSYQEISDVLDCPVNTVKTRMYHARRKLKILLEAS